MTQLLATARDIVAALAGIGMDAPPVAILGAISKTIRAGFLGDLSSCVAGADQDGSARRRLEQTLGCMSMPTVDALNGLGIVATLDDLAHVSRLVPARFVSALGAAQDPSHARHAEAKSFLSEMFSAKPWAIASSASAPGVRESSPGSAEAPVPAAHQACPDAAPENGASRFPIGETGRNYRSAHVYGSNFALCFNAVPSGKGSPGVMVDAAASSGPRAYDWDNAVHIMLDVREVTCVLAVFRNWRKGVEFASHGKMNDKSFALERQGATFFCKVSAKNMGVRAVKILAVDAHKVAMLFLAQLLLAYPDLPPTEVIALARTINEEQPVAGKITA